MYGRQAQGLSLLELLMALAVGSIVLAGVYGLFIQQQGVYSLQEQLIEMQQNIRLGMDFLVNDIRMAGFDPTGNAGARIIVATATRLRFTMDSDDNDATTVDDIAYELDTVQHELTRNINGSGRQPVVNNIVGLRFCYMLVNDPTCAPEPPGTALDHIRSVQIELTARTAHPDPSYRHPAAHHHYRTTTLTAIVHMRNLGLRRS